MPPETPGTLLAAPIAIPFRIRKKASIKVLFFVRDFIFQESSLHVPIEIVKQNQLSSRAMLLKFVDHP